MAVIPGSLQLHWSGSTGAFARKEGPNYTAVWRLQVDDPLDQSQIVLNWFRQNVVDLGTPYAYANDVLGSSALAENISATRIDTTCDWWEVTVDYQTPSIEDDEQTDESGNPTDDPFDWRPRLTLGSVHFRRPVQLARYVIGYGVEFNSKIPAGTSGIPPQNSAFTPFTNPSLEEDASRMWFSIGHNFPPPVDSRALMLQQNVVDSAGCSFNHRGIQASFGTYELKIREVKIQAKTQKGVQYVAIDWIIDLATPRQFTFGTNFYSWHSFPLDRGVYARAIAGDPDGKGGQHQDPPAGKPGLRLPLDSDDNPILEVVNFDGDGQPLVAGASPVYSEWAHYPEQAFTSMTYLSTLLGP